MRVAITGGNGFIGKYLVNELISNDIDPIILTRKDFTKNSVETIVTDYSYDSLKNQLIRVDGVVHLAFKRGKCGRIQEFHENENLTQVLFDACRDLNITNIVNASTISVYGNTSQIPWNENAIVQPDLMYGISKFTNECIGNLYSNKYGMQIKNLRIAHVFGFNEKNNYMINKFMRQAYLNKTLELDTPSKAKREFIYAKDVCRAIRLSLFYDKNNTFNIGSGINLTNEEVAKRINNVFKNKDNYLIKNMEQSETIKESYMDNNKALEILGYESKFNFEQALEEIYVQMKGLKNVPEIY